MAIISCPFHVSGVSCVTGSGILDRSCRYICTIESTLHVKIIFLSSLARIFVPRYRLDVLVKEAIVNTTMYTLGKDYASAKKKQKLVCIKVYFLKYHPNNTMCQSQ